MVNKIRKYNVQLPWCILLSGFEKMVFVITFLVNQKIFYKKNQKSKIEIKIKNCFDLPDFFFQNTQICR
jgi:hypothetical protein